MSKLTLGVLIGSLALNFALIGFIIGKENAPPPAFDPTRAFLDWSRSLEAHRFRELREVLRPHLPKDRTRMHDLRQQNVALARFLEAPTYDRSEIEHALSAMRESHLAAQEQSHQAFLSFIDALTPEERTKFAHDMRKRRHAFRRGPPDRELKCDVRRDLRFRESLETP